MAIHGKATTCVQPRFGGGWGWLAVGLLLPFLLTACAPPESTPKTTGPRIVSTVPAATAQLLQMGAGDALVGVSKYDLPNLPPEKQNTPVVGDYETLNYEQLVKLHPTAIVVQMAEERIPARLREVAAAEHFEVVNIRLDTVEDLFKTAGRLAKASGKEKDAAALMEQARTAFFRELAANTAGGDPPPAKVLYVVSPDPLIVVGDQTFMQEILRAAGGQNVAESVGKGYPTINRETLLTLAPEVVLISAPGEPPAKGDDEPRLRAWKDMPIPASKNGHVYLITDPKAEWATLAVADNVRALAKLLVPVRAGKAGSPMTMPVTAPATQPATSPAARPASASPSAAYPAQGPGLNGAVAFCLLPVASVPPVRP